MPRARSRTTDDWWESEPTGSQTAAAGQEGSGCLSGFIIPPLAVLLISGFLTLLALRGPVPARALGDTPAASPVQAMLSSPTPPPSEPASPPPAFDLNGDGLPDAETPAPTPTAETVTFIQELTPTPAAGFFPQIQAVIVTALAEANPPANDYSGTLAPFFRPEVLYWENSILRWSSNAGVDPNLAAVVMQIESCGDPRATSRSGAMGLFQVMPFHFRSGEDPYDTDTNALRGLSYLSRSLQTANGDARLALAGYNGGIGVISRGEWTWAAETARYVYFGAPMYEDARQGRSQSSALDEWYTRYGVSLCRQASQRQ